MAKFIVGDKLLRALYDAGVLGDDYTEIRRLIIDLNVGNVGLMYVEKFLSDDKIKVALTGGLEIVEKGSEAGITTGRTLPDTPRRLPMGIQPDDEFTIKKNGETVATGNAREFVTAFMQMPEPDWSVNPAVEYAVSWRRT